MLISPHVVRVDFGSHTYGYVFPSRGRKSRIHRLPQKSFPVERRIARKPDGCSLFPFSGDPLQLGQGQKLFDQPPAAVNAPKHISGGPGRAPRHSRVSANTSACTRNPASGVRSSCAASATNARSRSSMAAMRANSEFMARSSGRTSGGTSFAFRGRMSEGERPPGWPSPF